MGVNLDRVKAYRVYNRMDQLKMAECMGISKSAYANKEQGLKDFTSEEVGKMAKLFNVEPGDLFSREAKLK